MNDIDLLKQFRSHLDEPPPGALERARVVATSERQAARALPSRARWLILPAVATAVTAIALSVSMVLGQSPAPVTPPSFAPGASQTNGPARNNASELINQWAAVAEAGPAAPPASPGQTIALTNRVLQNGTWLIEQLTIEREGLIIVDNSEHGNRVSFQKYVADQRREFAASGPNISMPTSTWLAELDPSPAHLGQLMEVRNCGGQLCGDGRDDVVWNEVNELVRRGDVVLPPRVRSGLIRLLGTIEGVVAEAVTVDGQQYWSIGRDGRSSRAELYLDRDTGQFVGSGRLQLKRVRDAAACTSTGNARMATPPSTSPTACDLVPIPAADQQRIAITLYQQHLITP